MKCCWGTIETLVANRSACFSRVLALVLSTCGFQTDTEQAAISYLVRFASATPGHPLIQHQSLAFVVESMMRMRSPDGVGEIRFQSTRSLPSGSTVLPSYTIRIVKSLPPYGFLRSAFLDGFTELFSSSPIRFFKMSPAIMTSSFESISFAFLQFRNSLFQRTECN